MESHRFDTLTRVVATGRSRRNALSLLGSTLALPLLGWRPAEAKKKKTKKVTLCHEGQTITISKKARKQHLAHGDTMGACRDCGDDGCGGSCGPCPNGKICTDGVCACPAGQKACRGACIPQAMCCEDGDCANFKVCVEGTCQCSGNSFLCDGNCIPNTSCCTTAQCPLGAPKCCKIRGNQQYANGFCIASSRCCGNQECPIGQTCNPFTGQCQA